MRILPLRALTVALLTILSFPGMVAATGGPVAVGQPTTFVDENGVEQGKVTVTSVLDPFTDYPQDKPPD